ncbi:MAG: 3-oxoacyl-ACP reductase family protein [Steroidobacteraceae bacterium]|jgi:3-oxoacyl-[acyl-carrier protein] reductase
MADLQNAIALVTGASRGLGRAIALGLAEMGVDVVVNYRVREDEAQACADEIRRRARRAAIVRADVSRVDEARRLVREAEAALGPITILINNAGIARTQGLDDVTEADWDELIDVNLKSAFFVSQAVLPAMRAARWGRIINISSTAAHVGGVVGPHYAASKAGLIGLTHFFASRLARDGITVNAIAPALIRTDMLIQDLKVSAERIPVGRFGAPNEVASMVLSLVQNAYITGQTISVNGGVYMT